MIDKLVRGLATGAGLTAEEIMDVLWLAASWPATPVAPGPGVAAREKARLQPLGGNAGPAPAPESGLQLHPTVATASGRQTPAREVGFSAPRPINDALTLPTALRRLRQVRAPGPRLAVDIEATVDATAEAGRLMLVRTRPLERALDLALVVDDAPSVRIWEDIFDNLERLLALTGAFRTVSRWRLDPRTGAIRPGAHLSTTDPGQSALANGAQQSPLRLIDPSGRRLVLVATDARDQAWYTSPPWDAVAAWCALMPTALIQVLPPHYWPATAVGDSYLAMRSRQPAAPNGQFDRRIAWWATDPGGPPLPVVTLAPEAVNAWTQALVNGTAWTSGITATPPDQEHEPAREGPDDPRLLVNRFLSLASPGAQRLARVLASATILSMPLIAVLRDRLAPETGVLELAEILASGLIEETWPASGTGFPLLRYREGTAQLLQRGTTAIEEWDTYTAVSRYLHERRHVGGPLRGLVPDADGTAFLNPDDEPFAALYDSLAVRLGVRSPAVDTQTAPAREERFSNPLLQRIAQRQVDEANSFARQIALTAEISYDGEDRDWLLNLTREAEHSIDSISLSSVDAGRYGFDSGLWTSDLGIRYLELQRTAVARNVRIRRIFIIENEELAQDEGFLRVTQMQREIGIAIRMLDYRLIPDWMRSMISDHTIFDAALGYERIPAAPFTAGQAPPAVIRTLLSPAAARVRDLQDQFQQLWEAADPERPIDESEGELASVPRSGTLPAGQSPAALLQRIAQRQVDEANSFARQIALTAEISYDGEDRDWLLNLTREAEHSIDSISLSSVDAGRYGFDSGLWTSDLGIRYLELQRTAVARNVRIRRIFIIENEELAQDEGFLRVTQMQREIGIAIRMLDYRLIPDLLRPMISDYTIFDAALSYERTPAATFTTGRSQPTTIRTLLSPAVARVRDLQDQFEQLWEVADPVQPIDY